MDEPTAALTDAEIDELFRHHPRPARRRASASSTSRTGCEELKQISRPGDGDARRPVHRHVGRPRRGDIPTIITLMVGRTIYEAAPEIPERSDEVVLDGRAACPRPHGAGRVASTLRRGEILGVAGLVGAGRTEVARAIFGADPLESGEIWVHGRRVDDPQPDRRGRARHRLPVGGPQALRARARHGRRDQHRARLAPEVHGVVRRGSTRRRPGPPRAGVEELGDQDAERAPASATCPAATSRRSSSPSG